MTAAGKKAWLYRFTYVVELEPQEKRHDGAKHSTDVEFLFRTLDQDTQNVAEGWRWRARLAAISPFLPGATTLIPTPAVFRTGPISIQELPADGFHARSRPGLRRRAGARGRARRKGRKISVEVSLAIRMAF